MSTVVSRAVALAALGALALAYGRGLDAPGLIAPGEPRYAEIARTMVATGDWVVPRFNGEVHLEKPPLTYWAAATAFRLAGPSETAARVWPVACALATAWLCFLLAARIFDRDAALDGALVLLTCLGWWVYGRSLLTDVPAVLMQTGALWAFWRFRESERPLHAVLAGLWLAAGVMTRGLLGLVLPGAIVTAFVAATGHWHLLRRRVWLGVLLLVLALAAPWHVLVELRHPGFLETYLLQNHVARFFGHYPPGGNGALSLAQFLGVFAGGLFPWVLALPLLVRRLPELGRGGDPRAREGALYVAAWAAVTVLFTCLTPSKLERYFLPALPPLAVLLGAALGRALGAGRPGIVLFYAGTAAAGLALLGATLAGIDPSPIVASVRDDVPWIAAAFVLAPVLALRLHAGARRREALHAFCAVFAVAFVLVHRCLVHLDPVLSMAGTARNLEGVLDRDAVLVVDASYQHYEGVGFYLDRHVKVLRETDPAVERLARWDAALHPHVTPDELAALWRSPETVVLMARGRDRLDALTPALDPLYEDDATEDDAAPVRIVSNRPLRSRTSGAIHLAGARGVASGVPAPAGADAPAPH